jgi:hypothetical protein
MYSKMLYCFVKMAKDHKLALAKQTVFDNLEAIQGSLNRSVEEGMVDLHDDYYNEVLGLIEDARTADNWDELMEAIVRAQTLEMDIASWMSRRGRTTLSFAWPKKAK